MSTKEAGQDAYGPTFDFNKQSRRRITQDLTQFNDLPADVPGPEFNINSTTQVKALVLSPIKEDRKTTGNSFGRASSVEASNS